jgi:prepilin-type N-terminal cleavage/methylation domain-containing protein
MSKNPHKGDRGFTLIEIVIVMTIISVLAMLIVATIVSIRRTTRNTVRKSDAREVLMALEAYQSKHKTYPTVCGGQVSVYSNTVGWCAQSLKSQLNEYLNWPDDKADPSGITFNGSIRYCRVGTGYSLYVINEPSTTSNFTWTCSTPLEGEDITDFSMRL